MILLAGFLAEFVYERWLHPTQPLFQFAISLSSGLFLLLYGVTVAVHVVEYVWAKFGGTPASSGFTRYLPWTLAAVGVIVAAVAIAVPNIGRRATLGGTGDGSAGDLSLMSLEAMLGIDASLVIGSIAQTPTGAAVVV